MAVEWPKQERILAKDVTSLVTRVGWGVITRENNS